MIEEMNDRDQVNSFFRQYDSVGTFEVSSQQETDWEDYVQHQPGINPLLLPEWAGLMLIQDARLQQIFRRINLLPEPDRFILYFTARGNDPKLIAESITGVNISNYWQKLELARSHMKEKLGEVSNQEYQLLENELNRITEKWLDFSDRWDRTSARKKNKGRTIWLSVSSLMLLLGLYVFVWPLIFPLDGLGFFDKHHQVLISAIQDLPGNDLSAELLELSHQHNYEDCLALLDEELLMHDSLDSPYLAFYIALLIRQHDYQEVRHLLRKYQDTFPASLHEIFDGILWQIRFYT